MNLIKGYLPVRILLPSDGREKEESTFIFVKQHISYSETSARTLFVTNTPIYPSIKTSALLQAIFEKYADIERIIVAPKPTKHVDDEDGGDASVDAMAMSTFEKEIRSFGGDANGLIFDEDTWYDQGRYAHIIFSTSKGMKKFMSAFSKKVKDEKKKSNGSIKLSKLELQELQDISISMCNRERSKINHYDTNEDFQLNEEEEDKNGEEKSLSGIMKLVQSHRNRVPSREFLKSICEKIMTKYEDAEMEAQKRRDAAKNQPDEDGFVTVSYANNVGDATDFEKNGTLGSVQGRRGRERSRTKKKKDETVQDFYRFQMKESKKRHTEDLKNRFQEDLKRVKQMKEDKMYRPF